MKNENVFKQKLYSHALPVREGMWEAIEAQLPPNKEKRRFPFFWLILFSSAIAGGALMLTTFPHRESTRLQTPSSDNLLTPSLTSPSSHDLHTTPSTRPTLTQPDNASSSDVVTGDIKDQNQVHKYAERLSDASAVPHSSARPKRLAGATMDPSAVSIPDKHTSEPASPNISGSTAEAESMLPSLPSARNNRMTSPLPFTEVFVEDGDKFPFFNLQPDPHCYTFGGYATGFALSADLVAGPGFSVRSFEDTGGESLIYADARLNTERRQYAWTLGGRLNLHLNNGLGAKIGLSYHQAGDILDYRDSLAMQSSTRIDSFWAADGTFLYADTVRVFIPGTLIKKIHNTYRQLDVPLLLSYELILARSIIMINAGPVLNLTSSHKGQILDTALHPRPLSPGGTPGNQVNAYKNQLGLSFYLGAGVLFPLGSHTSVLLEPRFLYRIKPVTLPQYALKEHRHFAGLHLGLRYHFN